MEAELGRVYREWQQVHTSLASCLMAAIGLRGSRCDGGWRCADLWRRLPRVLSDEEQVDLWCDFEEDLEEEVPEEEEPAAEESTTAAGQRGRRARRAAPARDARRRGRACLCGSSGKTVSRKVHFFLRKPASGRLTD